MSVQAAAAPAAESNGVKNDGTASVPKPLAPAKLHGRAFYESIGSPKLILAPMVEQSEFVRTASGFLSIVLHMRRRS